MPILYLINSAARRRRAANEVLAARLTGERLHPEDLFC